MPPEDLIQALHQRPFVPFRMYLTDGTTYVVRHPDLLMVGRHSAVVGISGGDEPLYDRYETVALLHVVRLEPIDGRQQSQSTN